MRPSTSITRLSLAATIAFVSTPAILAAQTDEAKPAAKPAAGQDAKPKLETMTQKASYIIGHNIGSQMRSGAVELDFDTFLAGLRAALAGEKNALDQKTIQSTMQAAQKIWQENATKKTAAVAKQNLDEGTAFLANNKKLDGITTTASGLQYKVLKVGTGPKPTASSSVSVHYHGTLLDGTVFDSSVERGEPSSFGVNGVIRGWTEALQLMPTGSKWKLFIPSDLAYGEHPRSGGAIGPNAVLVFEVELLKIN